MAPTPTAIAPSCEECATELLVVGTGSPRYWWCRFCGTAAPIRD